MRRAQTLQAHQPSTTSILKSSHTPTLRQTALREGPQGSGAPLCLTCSRTGGFPSAHLFPCSRSRSTSYPRATASRRWRAHLPPHPTLRASDHRRAWCIRFATGRAAPAIAAPPEPSSLSSLNMLHSTVGFVLACSNISGSGKAPESSHMLLSIFWLLESRPSSAGNSSLRTHHSVWQRGAQASPSRSRCQGRTRPPAASACRRSSGACCAALPRGLRRTPTQHSCPAPHLLHCSPLSLIRRSDAS